jgi:hypothetical protein
MSGASSGTNRPISRIAESAISGESQDRAIVMAASQPFAG